MLHELLLALNGFSGSIFVQDKNSMVVKVVANLPFIHPAEETMLNRICRLATHYMKFQSFIREKGNSSCRGDSLRPGLFLRSFCLALDEILEPYRKTLVRVEKELLSDPHLTAAYVQNSLEEYQLLFPSLSSLIDEISMRKIYGCNVLEMLYRASLCGMPSVEAALQRILYICHKVLYKQLTSWMLHGLLLDQFSEFFIHRVDKGLKPSTSDVSVEDELGLGGVTGRQLEQILKLSETTSESKAYESFMIQAELLPSYIPVHAAEKILFVGESVQMFENQKIRPKQNYRGSILRDKEDEFAREINRLSEQPVFELMAFEDVIDKIRLYVAEQLWQLVVEETDLPSHLRVLKDFFLLGRGELFLAFIDQAQILLRPPATSTTQHDVNLAFHQAARNVLLEDEQLLQHFKLLIQSKDETGQSSSVNSLSRKESGWNCLNLSYVVDWPLHILFTPGVLDRYNTLFRFLLYVKRIQLELQHTWSLQMQRRHLRCTDPSATKWWLRSHMAFLVDNLQYYLQVDVIESQFSVLLDKIENTRDFEAIRMAHDHFLSSLLSQCFIHMKQISFCLKEILELCQAFCGLMTHSEVILSVEETSQLDEITKGFQRQSNLLFKVLSSVRSHQSSPHLSQLLLRIDFNKYFSMAGGQLGGKAEVVPATK